MVQYKRFLLGKHYSKAFRQKWVTFTGALIPKVIQEQIADNLKDYANGWAKVEGRTVRVVISTQILERVQHEKNI